MFRPKLVFALLAIAGAGIGAAAATANTDLADTGLACGVSTKVDGGLVMIEGIVESPTALTGEYRFALKSRGNGGSSNISQGGRFNAAPGAAISLGSIMVNAGATIDVDFSVTTGGKQFDCSMPLATRT